MLTTPPSAHCVHPRPMPCRADFEFSRARRLCPAAWRRPLCPNDTRACFLPGILRFSAAPLNPAHIWSVGGLLAPPPIRHTAPLPERDATAPCNAIRATPVSFSHVHAPPCHHNKCLVPTVPFRLPAALLCFIFDTPQRAILATSHRPATLGRTRGGGREHAPPPRPPVFSNAAASLFPAPVRMQPLCQARTPAFCFAFPRAHTPRLYLFAA